MQRVRIGLTGLAFVFLLVLLGAVFTSAREEEPGANLVEQHAAGTGDVEAKEPLAELGVAPGNADINKSARAVEPAGAVPAGQ